MIKEWRAGQKKKTSKPKNNARIILQKNNFIPERPGESSLDHHNLSNSQLFQQLENTSTKDKRQ